MDIKGLIDRPNELLKFIDSLLKPKELEKKKFGEVFTPMNLVNEMLDKLPKEVWTNKDLKWLDPSNGIGNYPFAIYSRLMESLKDKIPDIKLRKKHIWENMLYMCEINKKNIDITKEIINIPNLKIHEGDFLELDTKKVWNITKFDIILGNPPYQKENKKTTKARGGVGGNYYIDFAKRSISMLANDGYLLFIHPQNWRKIGSTIFSEFINRHILYLAINYGGDYFKDVSVKTDYYVLQNTNKKDYSVIDSYYKNNKYSSKFIIDKSINFIPNLFNEDINLLLKNVNLYGKQYECKISSDCHKIRDHVNKGKTNVYKYPLYNTSANPFEHYSSKPHKDQYKKKVILSNSGSLSPMYDDGVYGTTQDSMYIIVDNIKEGENIINILKTPIFKFLVDTCKWGNFRNEVDIFSYFKYPMIENISNSAIIEHYKLNKTILNSIPVQNDPGNDDTDNDDSFSDLDELPIKISKSIKNKKSVKII